jgi:hypothetical protein
MKRVLRSCRLAALVLACSGERTPRNDTTLLEEPPPDSESVTAPVSTWNRAAGTMFAVRSHDGPVAWLVNPAYGDAQALDTLTSASWNVEGAALSTMEGATILGTARVTGLKYDSTCAGWPTASLTLDAVAPATWRVAFPEGTVDGLTFDSLPALASTDSAARTREGALAASRVPDDTAAAFRGRPFIVRQASRFSLRADTAVTVFEIVRQVAQEANPLQEQILIISEGGPSGDARVAFHRREIGVEESMGSIELLGVLRVRSSGRVALLLRRERESGFIFEWLERSPRGTWTVRWRSATDHC